MKFCKDSIEDARRLPEPLASERERTKVLKATHLTVQGFDTKLDRAILSLEKLADEHVNLSGLVRIQHKEIIEELTRNFEGMRLEVLSSTAFASPPPPRTPFVPDGSKGCNSDVSAVNSKESEPFVVKQTTTVKIPQPSLDFSDGIEVDYQKTAFTYTSSVATKETETWLHRVVTSHQFEFSMGAVIVANACATFASLQVQGLHQAHKLGLRDGYVDIKAYNAGLNLLDSVFNCIYFIELMLRIRVHGKQFFMHMINLLDLVIVLISCIHSFVLLPMDQKAMNLSLLRLFRVCRIFRVAKILHFLEHVSELRVLLATLTLAIRGVVWCFVLLALVIASSGMLMTQLTNSFMLDASIEYDRRVWLHSSFGTPSASIYTMFESTFTTKWTAYAQPMIHDVSYLFAFFWVWWVLLVNFVTMRIIGALFLKQTMQVAAVDAERLAMDGMKHTERFSRHIRAIFRKADSDGNGVITRAEFESMLVDQTLLKEFKSLGLDFEQVNALFTVFSSDDGRVDYEELLHGALKMHSRAPTLDAVQSIHFQLKVLRSFEEVLTRLDARRTLA